MGLLSTIGSASGRAFGLTRLSAAIKDTYFNLVTLLLPGNGTNGAQNNTFLDSSTNNFTITRNGNTTQGTFSPFSQTGWSNYLGGSQNIYAPSNAAFGFGTGDFTVEFWLYLTSTPSSGQKYTLVDFRPTATGTPHTMYVANSSGTLYLGFYNGTSDITSSSQPIVANTWYHCAWSRASGTLRIYVNGNQAYSAANTIDYQSSRNITIGSAVDIGESMFGYLSNFRITKGGGLYTSAFTPSTSPLTTTVSSGTVTLLTCQSNRFVDNSISPITLSLTSTPSVQAFSPFAPTAAYSASTVGGSGYFDGSGDYLSVADNAAFDLGSGDFLIEAWAYSTNSTNFKMIIGQWNGSSNLSYTLRQNANKWAFTYTTNGSTEVALNGTSTQQLNAWAHLAVIRTGTTLSLFVNGTREATASVSGVTIFNNTGNFSIGGAGNGGDLWVGYVSAVRVIKTTLPSGYDATSTSITVPTAPPSSTASTSILCNFANAGITDATAKNDLETVGNAQISTAQNKFGGSSMLFDGNDALVIPYKELLDLKTTFTIEAWIYPTNVSAGYRGIYTITAAGGANYGTLALYHDGATLGFELRPTSGGGITAITGGTLSANTWQHVAFSMSSLSGRLFLNGTQVGSTTTFTNYSFTVVGVAVGNIGNNPTSTQGFVGYIDDLRITRGNARYTANFTAPSSAFELQ